MMGLQLDIREALSDEAVEAIRSLVERVATENMKVVDVGVWKGHSSSILGLVAKEHHGTVYAIDHWQGNPGTQNVKMAGCKIYETFLRNMKLLGLSDTVTPIISDSVSASNRFDDGSLDMVFIDADHRYQGIRADLEHWLPKVKKGGIIAGHDCERYYQSCTFLEKIAIRISIDMDYSKYIGHPGVILALWQRFNSSYSIKRNTTVWYKQI